MSGALNGKRFYEKGNYDLFIQPLNTDGSASYTGTVTKKSGMMSISLTFSQTTTNIAADDDPAYASFSSALTASGTLTLVGISKTEYEQFFGVYIDANGATVFDGSESPFLGLSFKDTITATDKTQVVNKITLNKVKLTLPPWETASQAEDNATIRNVAIPINAYPLRYPKANGEAASVTMSIINNTDHATIWAKAKDIIYIPDTVFGNT